MFASILENLGQYIICVFNLRWHFNHDAPSSETHLSLGCAITHERGCRKGISSAQHVFPTFPFRFRRTHRYNSSASASAAAPARGGCLYSCADENALNGGVLAWSDPPDSSGILRFVASSPVDDSDVC